MLWNVTDDGGVNLNPIGFTSSEAVDIEGDLQVGFGSGPTTGENAHALLWQGTADSVLDLHSYLAATGRTFIKSVARAVDPDGNVYGFGVDAIGYLPIVWLAVPEPPAIAFVVVASVAISLRIGTRSKHDAPTGGSSL